MNAVPRPTVPGSMSNAAYEQRLRDAVMDAAPLLSARVLPVNVRSAALNKALAAGLPQLRDDLWRYADLKFLGAAALAPIAPLGEETRSDQVTQLLPPRIAGFQRLVLVNGRVASALSDFNAELDPLAAPLVPDRTRHERFGWLNDAFAIDVARIAVSGELRLEVISVCAEGAARQAVYPRLEIMVAADANLVLMERHVGGVGTDGYINIATQVHAGVGSQVQHLRWQSLDADAQCLDTTQVALDRHAHYRLALLQTGGRSARTSLRASLYGEAAQLQLHGVCVAGGRLVQDHSFAIDHLARHTQSTQVFRAIARDHARIACRSRVEVTQRAGGSRADQSLKGIIATVGAEIDLRPQLEIFTDEVRASHGATTGALDENMRFYLLSRGLDADTARSLLEWAFLEDAVRGIELPALRTTVEQSLARVLGSQVASQVVQ